METQIEMETQTEDDADDIELYVYGNAIKLTRQYSPYPLFFDSIYGVGARDWSK